MNRTNIGIPSSLRLAISVMVCWWLAALNGWAETTDEKAVPVTVATAKNVWMAPTSWYAGTLISRNVARIASEEEGRLIWVADVGEGFKQGQVVARLDDSLLKEVQQERLSEMERELARVDYFVNEVDRLITLAKKSYVDASQLAEMTLAHQVARTQMAVAKARLGQVEERLRRTRIKAPFDGVVVERYRQGGEWVESGIEVVRLVNLTALEAQTRVPRSVARLLTPGNQLQIRVDQQVTNGTIRTIVPVGDELSSLFEVRLQLTDADWVPGVKLQVAAPIAEARHVVAVPRDALVIRRNSIHVFTVTDDLSAKRIEVTTGVAEGELIEVIGDIQPGDRVVIRGGERLRQGQRVELTNGELKDVGLSPEVFSNHHRALL